MKPLYAIKFLALALITCLTLSCEKDDPVSTVVELLSFGPSGAKHGEQLRIIGNNLQKVNAVELVGASVPASEFVQHSTELILITIPTSAERGPIILKTSEGDITSVSSLNLDALVEITSMTETVKPGELLTIQGNYLNWVTAVTFESDIVVEAAAFESQSRTELVVRLPMEAKTGNIILSYGGTEPDNLESENPLQVVLPALTSFSPSPVRHGNELTLTGTHLDLVKSIAFSGRPEPVSEFVSQSETSIQVVIPDSVNHGKITLIAYSDVAVESEEALAVVLPTATAFQPSTVARSGELRITGTELTLVQGVLFKGVEQPVTDFKTQTDTEIVLLVPEAANKGTLTLRTHSQIDVETTMGIEIVGDLPPLAPLGYAIYQDAILNGWGNWGWNGTVDFDNAENVRDGERAIKKVYDASYGALRFGGGNVSTAPYNTIVFSVFGTPGTDGLQINVIANEQWGAPHIVTIVEGEWTEYHLTKEQLGITDALTDLLFQDRGWSGTLYVDHVGLR